MVSGDFPGEGAGRAAGAARVALAELAFRGLREGIMITDANNQVLAVNPAFSTITGYDASEAVGRNPRFLGSGMQDKTFYQALWKSLHDTGSWRGQLLNRRKSGEQYAQLLSISVLRDAAGAVTHHVALLLDITDIQEKERALRHIADHDMLSGLPNRRLLEDRLHHALARARREDQLLVVCYLDLDGFKSVNDVLGHLAGDALLQETSRRLLGSVRAGDTVARLGGDEFVLVLEALQDTHEAEQVLRRVLANVAAPVHVGTGQAGVTASIGAVAVPTGTQRTVDADDLLRRADAAMYLAKDRGRNRFVWAPERHGDDMGTG